MSPIRKHTNNVCNKLSNEHAHNGHQEKGLCYAASLAFDCARHNTSAEGDVTSYTELCMTATVWWKTQHNAPENGLCTHTIVQHSLTLSHSLTHSLYSLTCSPTEEREVTDEGEEEPSCTRAEVTPCETSDSPPSISATPSSSSSSPSPTPTEQDIPTTSSTSPTTPPPEEEGDGEESDALVNLNLTKETVIVMGIGVFLFIVLVVLVVVLVACIFHKRKPSQFRFKAPPPGRSMCV